MPPSPPTLPPGPPYQPTAIGDARFGCGYPGPHLVEASSTETLIAATEDDGVTCIKLAPVVYALPSTLHIVGRLLAIVADDGQATLDGGGSVQLIYVEGADVALANLRLSNGFAIDGGAIYNLGGTMAMYTCVLDGNRALVNGGAIYNGGGTMTMDTCAFNVNHAGIGGALYLIGYYANVEMATCTFDGNRATNSGGAIYNIGKGHVAMDTCAFDDNRAGRGGGAISHIGTTIEIRDGIFTNNAAMVGFHCPTLAQ